MESVLIYLERNQPRFVDELCHYVRFRSVSAQPQHKADLLVIASQDRRPLVAKGLVDIDRLLGSSVSDYIRVHAPAPVLLVREPEGRR